MNPVKFKKESEYLAWVKYALDNNDKEIREVHSTGCYMLMAGDRQSNHPLIDDISMFRPETMLFARGYIIELRLKRNPYRIYVYNGETVFNITPYVKRVPWWKRLFEVLHAL